MVVWRGGVAGRPTQGTPGVLYDRRYRPVKPQHQGTLRGSLFSENPVDACFNLCLRHIKYITNLLPCVGQWDREHSLGLLETTYVMETGEGEPGESDLPRFASDQREGFGDKTLPSPFPPPG